MPTPMRRRLRLARRGLAYAVALALVLVALVLAVASQILPMAESNPQRIAAWLSERAGRPVTFDRVETAWTRRGPLLRLDNLRVGAGEQAFTVGDAEMLVSVYAGLLPGHAFSELRLRGLDLTLERADDGRWNVRGLPGQEQPAQRDPLSALEGLGELQVVDGKLAVIAPAFGIDARIPRISLRLRVDGPRVRAGVRAWPSVGVPGAASSPLDAVLDFDRKLGDGRAYLGTRRADLSAWAPLLQVAGIGSESGQGRAEAWADLRGHRITQVVADVALDRVGLRGTPLAGGAVPRVAFARVEALARWRVIDGGWRADAKRLRIDSVGKPQKLDGLAVAGGRRYALLADRIDAGPLLAAAALSDRLAPGLRVWLQNTRPQVALRKVEVAGVRGGAMRAHARIDAFGFDAVGNAPGLGGLAGDFDGDADGFALNLDPASPMRFDWPRGFGVPHTVSLQGTVGGWREGNGWRIGTPALRVKGDGFGVHARGGLWWQGDGSRPRIDLAADIDEAQIPVAKGFWIRHVMSPRLVGWLDNALVGGRLHDGRAVVSGDLDDWPFRDRNGLFEARARLDDAVVKFQADWPAVDGLDADVAFIADGFTVQGQGRLAGVGMRQIRAGIDHYRNGALTVQAQGAGDAAQLLALLRQSPLQKDHADTLGNVVASGAAAVTFDMDMPLRPGSTTAIGGTVELKDAKLADPRWKLAFDQVNGSAEYARGGFRADGLKVRHEGQPGELSLRAGADFVRDKGNVFEGGLDAQMSGAGTARSRAGNGVAQALRGGTLVVDGGHRDPEGGARPHRADTAATAVQPGRHGADAARATAQGRRRVAADVRGNAPADGQRRRSREPGQRDRRARAHPDRLGRREPDRDAPGAGQQPRRRPAACARTGRDRSRRGPRRHRLDRAAAWRQRRRGPVAATHRRDGAATQPARRRVRRHASGGGAGGAGRHRGAGRRRGAAGRTPDSRSRWRGHRRPLRAAVLARAPAPGRRAAHRGCAGSSAGGRQLQPGEDSAAHHRHRRPARVRRAPGRGEAAHAAKRHGHAHRTGADAWRQAAHRRGGRMERPWRHRPHAAGRAHRQRRSRPVAVRFRHGAAARAAAPAPCISMPDGRAARRRSMSPRSMAA